MAVLRSGQQGSTEGISLFNPGRIFEAHEVLEAAWLEAEAQHRKFLHGLIHVSAAFHYYTRGNPARFWSPLQKDCAKLENTGGKAEGADLGARMLELWPRRERPGRPPSQAFTAPRLLRITMIQSPSKG